jgi:hypothetical protein
MVHFCITCIWENNPLKQLHEFWVNVEMVRENGNTSFSIWVNQCSTRIPPYKFWSIAMCGIYLYFIHLTALSVAWTIRGRCCSRNEHTSCGLWTCSLWRQGDYQCFGGRLIDLQDSYPEYGCYMFLRKAGNRLQDHRASEPRRSLLTYLSPQEHQIPNHGRRFSVKPEMQPNYIILLSYILSLDFHSSSQKKVNKNSPMSFTMSVCLFSCKNSINAERFSWNLR